MEPNNRQVWIYVAVVLVVACCCALAVVVAAGGLFFVQPSNLRWGDGSVDERTEQIFDVGREPELAIDNFAGGITVRTGEGGAMQVVAIKKAPLGRDLDRIKITISEQRNGLMIRTRKPASMNNASVQLEIAVPYDTHLEVRTGAGSVQVAGLGGDVKADSGAGSIEIINSGGDVEVETGAGSVTLDRVAGQIDAHSGTGSMEVRGASGPVRLDTGAGSIDYEGAPSGECRFETGTGSITLALPSDLSAEVDLHTGIGTVTVAYDVVGTVSRQAVRGAIGSGEQASIYAHTGAGSIDLIRR
jgi:DUF4097 and DUF4098 domain-containing protein YvlB